MIEELNIDVKKTKIVSYVRLNGYRILLKLWLFLTFCAGIMIFIGIHFEVLMIAAAMILLTLILFSALLCGVIVIEMWVIKVKRYKPSQITQIYQKLVEVSKN